MTNSQSPAAAVGGESLDAYLKTWVAAGEGREGLAKTIAGLAGVGVALSEIIAGGALSGALRLGDRRPTPTATSSASSTSSPTG